MAEIVSLDNSLNFARQILKAKANHLNKIITAQKLSTKSQIINIGDGEYNTEIIYFFSDKSELKILKFDSYWYKYVDSSSKQNNYD